MSLLLSILPNIFLDVLERCLLQSLFRLQPNSFSILLKIQSTECVRIFFVDQNSCNFAILSTETRSHKNGTQCIIKGSHLRRQFGTARKYRKDSLIHESCAGRSRILNGFLHVYYFNINILAFQRFKIDFVHRKIISKFLILQIFLYRFFTRAIIRIKSRIINTFTNPAESTM